MYAAITGGYRVMIPYTEKEIHGKNKQVHFVWIGPLFSGLVTFMYHLQMALVVHAIFILSRF